MHHSLTTHECVASAIAQVRQLRTEGACLLCAIRMVAKRNRLDPLRLELVYFNNRINHGRSTE